MNTPIGYVETVREDLLDAAWRSTMSSPMRARRRLPSKRWVIAGATAMTLLAAGVVGWMALRPGGAFSIRSENGALPAAKRPTHYPRLFPRRRPRRATR